MTGKYVCRYNHLDNVLAVIPLVKHQNLIKLIMEAKKVSKKYHIETSVYFMFISQMQ